MSEVPEAFPATSLSVRIGHWFEANATGRGVFAVPLVLLMIILAIVVGRWLYP